MTPEWRPYNSSLTPSGFFSSPSAAAMSGQTLPPPLPSSSSSTMPAIASSSRPSGSRLAPNPRRDVFKPKFPLDPFAGSSAAALAEPWFLKLDAVLAATALQRRDVILVLGAPTLKELAPLLQSQHLANSLVILATHNPPDIPGIVYPAVRILVLSAPLALEDQGAVRFVNVLEWAERVARSWRKHFGGGVQELSEEVDINSDLPPPPVLRFGSQSTPASPGSSSTHLSPTPSRSSSRPSSIASAFFFRSGQLSLPPSDPSQRPFDALVHFMPDNVSDKALLKTSILVTTISRPFLTSSVHPSPLSARARTTSSGSTRLRPRSILNAFSRSSASVYLPPTPPYQSGESLSLSQMVPPPPGKALLIHLLPTPHPSAPPAARRRLVDGIESFLLSFAFQSVGVSFQPVPGLGGLDVLERARPYVMPVTTFQETVECNSNGEADYGEWSVADIVLSGLLDADTPNGPVADGATPGMKTTMSANAIQKLAKVSKRAWIATAADLVIMPSSEDSSGNGAPASPEAYHIARPRTEPALPTIHQNRPFEKSQRSSSAPLLSDVGGRGMSPPPKAMARYSKGTYKPTSPASLRSQSGLPTPPPSEEESGVECISLDAEISSTHGADESDGKSTSGGGSVRKYRPRWKFWRRHGAGHVPGATTLKA